MRLTAWCGVLLVLAGAAAHANDSVLQVFVGSEVDSRVEEVLYLAAGVELTRAGLTSRRTQVPVTDSSGAIDRSLVSQAADRAGADLVLLMAYERRASEIHIELLLDRPSFDGPLAERSMTTPFDLDLDSRVAAVVRELIEEAGVERSRTAQTSIEGFGFSPRPPAAGPAAPEPTVIPPELPRVSGPEFAVATSGLLVVGGATELFRYGVAGSLSGGYVPAGRRLGILVGARSSVIRFFTEESVVGGDLYVVTAGPDIHIGSAYRSPARVAVRSSAGVAALVIVGAEETLAKSVPFVDLGVAVRLPLGRVISIGMEVNYLTVLEPDFPLMGFTPAFTVSLEL